MPLLDLASGSHTIHLFGITLSFGPSGIAAVIGWALFACGAYVAVRERVTGRRFVKVPALVGAGATLAAMSAGLGLLLGESYPTFARVFCFPYALLALAVAVLGRALHAGGRPIGGEE
jgi:ABC-type sulfate transport system permease component